MNDIQLDDLENTYLKKNRKNVFDMYKRQTTIGIYKHNNIHPHTDN